MTFSEFLNDPDWDKPFFKRLASNDTGAAPGHQGGLVIPKDLRTFFPGLVGPTTASNPTVDRRIWADLFDGQTYLGRVNTRYQFQTWGGERSPESRLTDHLSPLRSRAAAGEILIVQRSLIDLDLYRLILIRKRAPVYAAIDKLAVGRWGVLDREPPMSENDYEEAIERENAAETEPFKLFDSDAKTTNARATRVARSVVFKTRVVHIYQRTCCVCNTSLQVPEGPLELEAAHIVPRRILGSDDARNGLGLCRRHHWAFDKGLFGIDRRRRVYVPSKVLHVAANKPLEEFVGRPINEASVHALEAAPAALEWHMKNVVLD